MLLVRKMRTGGLNEALSDMRWRLGGCGFHQWLKGRTTSAFRFKTNTAEADWLAEGEQEHDCTRVMISVLSLTAWESGSDIKNRLAAWKPRNNDRWMITDHRLYWANVWSSFKRNNEWAIQKSWHRPMSAKLPNYTNTSHKHPGYDLCYTLLASSILCWPIYCL